MTRHLSEDQLRIWNAGFTRDNDYKSFLIAYYIDTEYGTCQFASKKHFLETLSDDENLFTISGKEDWSYHSLSTICEYQPWLESVVQAVVPKRDKPTFNVWDARIQAPIPIDYTSRCRGDWQSNCYYIEGDVVMRRENLRGEGMRKTQYRCCFEHRSSQITFSLDYEKWEKLDG